MKEAGIFVPFLQSPYSIALGPICFFRIVQSSKFFLGSSQLVSTTLCTMPLNDRVNLLTQIFYMTVVAFVPTSLPATKGSANHVAPLQDITLTFDPRISNNIFGISIFSRSCFKEESHPRVHRRIQQFLTNSIQQNIIMVRMSLSDYVR